MAKLLRREPNEIEALFSGKPFFLRRALDSETAYRFLGAMKHAGLVCRLVPTGEVIPVVGEQPAPTAVPVPVAPSPPKAKLELAKPKLELAPADDPPPTPATPAPAPAPPTVFSECPKCRYRARGPQDGLISQGVCPACGLIIAKYLQLQAARNPPKTSAHSVSATPAPAQSNNLEFDELPPGLLKLMSLEFTLPPDITLPEQPKRAPTASLKRRLLAAIATYLSAGFLMVGPTVLGIILLLIMLNVALSIADDLGAARNTVGNFENYELIVRSSLGLLGLWLGFVYLPGKWEGLTYGQRLMRIAPVRKDGDEVTLPDTAMLLQRLAGNIMAFFTLPIALLWLVFGRSRRSIADRLSDCRQIEVGAAPDSPVLKALSPLAYGILLGLTAAVPLVLLTNCAENTLKEIAKDKKSFSERMLGEPPTPMRKATKTEEFGSPQVILERLVEFQRQYYAHHQRYTDAVEELIMESPDRQSPMMLAMLVRQQLKIQLVAGGFKIGLRRDNGWHIATEEGYQGVQPSF